VRLADRPCRVGVAHGAAGELAERRRELGAGRKKGKRRKNTPIGGPGASVGEGASARGVRAGLERAAKRARPRWSLAGPEWALALGRAERREVVTREGASWAVALDVGRVREREGGGKGWAARGGAGPGKRGRGEKGNEVAGRTRERRWAGWVAGSGCRLVWAVRGGRGRGPVREGKAAGRAGLKRGLG